VALNIGSSDWQRQRIADAYDVAKTIGTNFKFFISFDFTEMGYDLNDIVSRTRTFSDHPVQLKIDGKAFVSSYAGDCLRNGGWASLKAQTNAYIIPFIWGLEGQFNSWSVLDSWYWFVSSLFEVWDGF
jgi:glucan endo-1,3-alpha-glucosidase